MSVVKINAVHVPQGRGAELQGRFAAREHAVDSQAGFEGFQLLSPVRGDSRYFVMTTWESEESYETWCTGQTGAQHGAPNPVATVADLLEFELVDL